MLEGRIEGWMNRKEKKKPTETYEKRMNGKTFKSGIVISILKAHPVTGPEVMIHIQCEMLANMAQPGIQYGAAGYTI